MEKFFWIFGTYEAYLCMYSTLFSEDPYTCRLHNRQTSASPIWLLMRLDLQPGHETWTNPTSNIEFSDHSRPLRTISSSATSPLSSTLTPPPDPLAVHVHDYRAGQLAPELTAKHDRKAWTRTNSSLRSNSSPSAAQCAPPSRPASCNSLPPKKPDLVLHPSPNNSCFVLPCNSPPAKIHIKPPACPPRSVVALLPPSIPSPTSLQQKSVALT
ncbi:hypothetical protein VP01_457g5 [Puccinia sorghi]|uniref:Uncharacterized protein n=1 Tax=Puccinia sorghi TaxID=27349 RepID=A0A0L6UNM2_9BASI|nr:hypothetical protein VP01_457g5 [Puccinia sorghi]